MNLKFLKTEFSVCKLRDLTRLNLAAGLFFLAKTADEISLVCPIEDVPPNTLAATHGWKGFVIEGQLDFSMVGVMASLSGILANIGIAILALSTHDTDYVIMKADRIEEAKQALAAAGYTLT